MADPIPHESIKTTLLMKAPYSALLEQSMEPSGLRDNKNRKTFIEMLREKFSSNEPEKAKVLTNTTVTFNTATWLRFTNNHCNTISLLLCYKDGAGEYEVVVDESPAGSCCDVMLSGNLEISIKGKLESISVCCSGISKGERYLLDSVHLNRIQEKKEELGKVDLWRCA